MEEPKLITILRESAKLTHFIERVISQSDAFKGEKFPYKSPTIQMAFNEIRFAKMFGLECFRLITQGNKHRLGMKISDEANHEASIDYFIKGATEQWVIHNLITYIKDILYKLIDENDLICRQTNVCGCNNQEFFLYYNQFMAHLKKAELLLSLRLTEPY